MDSSKGMDWGRPNHLLHIEALFHLHFIANATLLAHRLKKKLYILLHLFPWHMTSPIKQIFLRCQLVIGVGWGGKRMNSNREIHLILLNLFVWFWHYWCPSEAKRKLFSVYWVSTICYVLCYLLRGLKSQIFRWGGLHIQTICSFIVSSGSLKTPFGWELLLVTILWERANRIWDGLR